ncbi:MAG: DUF4369 domain-containing protein [Flavobacteriaceae bacterium]|nr:DUF4369 domain-containing protein [Flavobacteriaceae bacterium]
MKKILVLGIVLLAAACSSKKEGNMVVNGQIKGLKKGTLYLQKVENDSILKTIDSVAVMGSDQFTLTANVEEPEMYSLTFNGNTTNKYITFFAEPGTITINDDVAKFGINPEIKGSKNQEILNKYSKISRRFNNQNLDLIKLLFLAQKSNNKDSIELISKKQEQLLKRRYLVTVNFALNNKENPVSPYIALTELTNVRVKWLDTIYKSLTPTIKSSLYGKKLEKLVTDIKEAETKK